MSGGCRVPRTCCSAWSCAANMDGSFDDSKNTRKERVVIYLPCRHARMTAATWCSTATKISKIFCDTKMTAAASMTPDWQQILFDSEMAYVTFFTNTHLPGLRTSFELFQTSFVNDFLFSLIIEPSISVLNLNYKFVSDLFIQLWDTISKQKQPSFAYKHLTGIGGSCCAHRRAGGKWATWCSTATKISSNNLRACPALKRASSMNAWLNLRKYVLQAVNLLQEMRR